MVVVLGACTRTVGTAITPASLTAFAFTTAGIVVGVAVLVGALVLRDLSNTH
jgi:hypothetical protein